MDLAKDPITKGPAARSLTTESLSLRAKAWQSTDLSQRTVTCHIWWVSFRATFAMSTCPEGCLIALILGMDFQVFHPQVDSRGEFLPVCSDARGFLSRILFFGIAVAELW